MPGDFFSFSHTESVTAASHSNRIAWIVYKNGIRTLFTAEEEKFLPVTVCHARTDKNESISTPLLSPSGHYLAYRHHTHRPLKKNKSTLVVTTLTEKSLTFHTLASGEHLCFDEANHRLFFVRENTPDKISVFDLKTSKTVTNYQAPGRITALVLCPQSSYLAMSCHKSSRHFISICDANTNTPYWHSEGFENESAPLWSPSGKKLALIQQHFCPQQESNPLPNSGYPPFSLKVLDMQTRTCQTIWSSRDSIISGKSSQEGSRPVSWIDDNQIIFCHEGCGWEHAYCMDIKTRETTAISSGDFLVRDMAACALTGKVFFSCNDNTRQQFRMLCADKSKAVTVLPHPQEKNSIYPMSFTPAIIGKTGRYMAFLSSSEKHSTRLTLLDRKRKHITQPSLVTKPAQTGQKNNPNLVTPSLHTLKSRDGKSFHGQLFRPESGGTCPAILLLHDGPGKQNLPGFQPSLEMSFQYALCQYLASQGFAVMNINYRGSGGYNKGFREAKNRGWKGASEYDDVIAAGKWLAQQDFIHSQKISVIGKGWGGYLSAMALAKDSQLFRAGVCIHGFYHFPRFMRALSMQHPEKPDFPFTEVTVESTTRHIAHAKLAVEYSPWHYLDQWMSPVLIVHADNNEQVPFSESQLLYQELKYRGVNVKNLILSGETHDFTWHHSWQKLAEKIVCFLQENLS